MGLADMQRVLARLYTNAPLRERFHADPLAVARELGFSDEEARRLAEVPPARLDSFARSLHSKRLGQVAKLLPLSRRALGQTFDEAFRRFADSYVPKGTKKHLGDALAFADYLEHKLRRGSEHPRWLLDLLRYERARLKAADPARRVVASFFRHDISRLVRSVARREETPAAEPRLTVAVWWRPQRRGTVRYAVYSAPQFLWRGGKERQS